MGLEWPHVDSRSSNMVIPLAEVEGEEGKSIQESLGVYGSHTLERPILNHARSRVLASQIIWTSIALHGKYSNLARRRLRRNSRTSRVYLNNIYYDTSCTSHIS